MVFNSLQFVWFFLAVYALYRLLPAILPVQRAHRAQNWLLLVASYDFYAAWDYRFLALLAASTIVDYTCGRLLGSPTDARWRRRLLVAYFRHLVGGAIMRATALLPQIARPRCVTGEQMRQGLWLIAWGFFQKIFVADNLAPLASHVFAPAAHPSGVNVLAGLYAFAFQIYGDFAGYSNIARGPSKLMGIELIVNFRFPYLVVTPQAFWRHWHISLSTWPRDYLYIPLGAGRG